MIRAKSASEFCFDGKDQLLHVGDATMLAHRAITWWANPLSLDPISKCITVKNAVSVADDVFGRLPVTANHSRYQAQQRVGAVDARAQESLNQDSLPTSLKQPFP